MGALSGGFLHGPRPNPFAYQAAQVEGVSGVCGRQGSRQPLIEAVRVSPIAMARTTRASHCRSDLHKPGFTESQHHQPFKRKELRV